MCLCMCVFVRVCVCTLVHVCMWALLSEKKMTLWSLRVHGENPDLGKTRSSSSQTSQTAHRHTTMQWLTVCMTCLVGACRGLWAPTSQSPRCAEWWTRTPVAQRCSATPMSTAWSSSPTRRSARTSATGAWWMTWGRWTGRAMLLKEVSEGTGKIGCVGVWGGGMVDDMRKVDWQSDAAEGGEWRNWKDCVCVGGEGGMVDDMRKVDWKSGAYSSSKLAYFTANPQYLGVFPISTTCGHALLGMVTPSLNWKLTCQGRLLLLILSFRSSVDVSDVHRVWLLPDLWLQGTAFWLQVSLGVLHQTVPGHLQSQVQRWPHQPRHQPHKHKLWGLRDQGHKCGVPQWLGGSLACIGDSEGPESWCHSNFHRWWVNVCFSCQRFFCRKTNSIYWGAAGVVLEKRNLTKMCENTFYTCTHTHSLSLSPIIIHKFSIVLFPNERAQRACSHVYIIYTIYIY